MTNAAKTKLDIYGMITSRVLTALENGVAMWHKPWNTAEGAHMNLKSKKFYRGINQFLLGFEQQEKGYPLPYWLSYKQAASMGGQVRKGETSTIVTFWKILEDKADPTHKIPLLRYYRVFNVAQIDGLEGKLPKLEPKPDFDPIAECEQIWDGWENKPSIGFGGSRASYSPPKDHISMPVAEDFVGNAEYYSTLFHEGVHATGHSTRLNRKDGMENIQFGSEKYSEEELVAEMGAAFLCGFAGIENKTIDNSAAYIQGWLKKIGSDPKLVVKAAGKAQKAADMILGTTFDNDTKEDENA